MKFVVSLLVSFMAASPAFAAPYKLKTSAMSGEEYVKALASVCTDEEWAKVAPLIKISKLATTEVASQEFTIDGATVSGGGVTAKFEGDKAKVTIGGTTYEGTVCGVLAQYASVPAKKTSALSLMMSRAQAEEFLPTTVTEALTDKFRREPLATTATVAAHGVAGLIGLSPWTFCTACTTLPSLVDREQLERNRDRLEDLAVSAARQDDFRVSNCDANTVTLAGGRTRLVIDRRAHQVTVSNGRVTGHIASNPPFGVNYEESYARCRSAADARSESERLARQRVIANEVRSDRLDGIILPRRLQRPPSSARPPKHPAGGYR